jgi:uncharacterized membrane protein
MESKAKLLGHPIHPMLIVFPLGLLATAAIFDVIYLVSGADGWAYTSFYLIGAGIIGGLLAAAFGLVDFLAIPRGTRARRIGALHGIGNVIVVGLFTVSLFLRLPETTAPSLTAILLSVGGMLLALVTGWMGGELVDRLAVGVDDGANLDAPSSLSGRPARDDDRRMAAD